MKVSRIVSFIWLIIAIILFSTSIGLSGTDPSDPNYASKMTNSKNLLYASIAFLGIFIVNFVGIMIFTSSSNLLLALAIIITIFLMIGMIIHGVYLSNPTANNAQSMRKGVYAMLAIGILISTTYIGISIYKSMESKGYDINEEPFMKYESNPHPLREEGVYDESMYEGETGEE
jgi:hypothetical protein